MSSKLLRFLTCQVSYEDL